MTTRMMSLAILATACTATRSFTGVSGSGPDDVWVVGASTPAESSSSSPYVFHWDGAAWMSRADVATSGLSGVWSPTANNVWFAGDTMVHYDGTAWTSTLGQNYTRAVWGDGSGTVWAVGLDGLTVRVDASGAETTPSSGTSKALFSVWGSGASDVWAVGLDAAIIHWQGTRWTASPSSIGMYTSLHSVSGNASHDVWSVGDSGTIVHWDGSAWSTVPSSTTLDLEGVWADGADDVWAVGGHATGSHSGTILHFDGSRWSQSYHSDSTLRAVWGTASNNVWAVGDDLVVVHWDGAKWTSRELSP
ncbi:MAG TPA: hypothetical protein VIX73_10360 [Kofleriaceae bacterium]|jgi:hypothetical protein